jgi:hypothetical protein
MHKSIKILQDYNIKINNHKEKIKKKKKTSKKMGAIQRFNL